MAATKIKGLQMWCRRMTDGYDHIDIANFTSSWRDGMAFCALIHRYRPDLIDYESLSPENVFENCKLAFEVAEQELDIPAFLEAEDMAALKAPDKLSVITYVSQYYNVLSPLPQLGGPGVRSKFSNKTVSGTKRQNDSDSNHTPAKRMPEKQTKENAGRTKEKAISSAIGDICGICQNRVYLMERHMDGGKLYHRSCFRHSELSPTNKVYTRSPFLSPSLNSETPSFTYPTPHSAMSDMEKSSKGSNHRVESEIKMTPAVVASIYKRPESAGTKHQIDDPVKEISKKSKLHSKISLDEEKAKKASAIIDRLQSLKAKYSGNKSSEVGSPLPLSGKEARKIEKRREEVLASLRPAGKETRKHEKNQEEVLSTLKPVEEPIKGSKRNVPLILQQNDKITSGALRSDLGGPASKVASTITPASSSLSASGNLPTRTSSLKSDSLTTSCTRASNVSASSNSSSQSAHLKDKYTDVRSSVELTVDQLKKNMLSKSKEHETNTLDKSGLAPSSRTTTAQPVAKPRTGAPRTGGELINQDPLSTKTVLKTQAEQKTQDPTPKPAPRKSMFENLDKPPALEQPKIPERKKSASSPKETDADIDKFDSPEMPSSTIPPPLPTSPPPPLPASYPVGRVNPPLADRSQGDQPQKLVVHELKLTLDKQINESTNSSQDLPLETDSSILTVHGRTKLELSDKSSTENVTAYGLSKSKTKKSPEDVAKLDSPEAETRIDSSEAETRIYRTEAETRIDRTEAETKIDSTEAETRIDSSEAETRIDSSEAETRIDSSEAETRIDGSEAETRIDRTEAETRIDSPEAETRIDSPEAETRIDSPEAETRIKLTTVPFDRRWTTPISTNDSSVDIDVSSAENESSKGKTPREFLTSVAGVKDNKSYDPVSSNVTLSPIETPPFALPSFVPPLESLQESSDLQNESILDSLPQSSANETSPFSTPAVNILRSSKSEIETTALSTADTVKTYNNHSQSATLDSQQNVEMIRPETSRPDASRADLINEGNHTNFESKCVLNLVVDNTKPNSENRSNIESDCEQNKLHPTPVKRSISNEESRNVSSLTQNNALSSTGNDLEQVQSGQRDSKKDLSSAACNVDASKEPSNCESTPQKPPRLIKMAKLASQEKQAQEEDKTNREGKTSDPNFFPLTSRAIADGAETPSLQLPTEPHTVPVRVETTDASNELPQWKKDIEERKKKLREDIAKSESETGRFKHLREKAPRRPMPNPDTVGHIENNSASQNKSTKNEPINDNAKYSSDNGKGSSSEQNFQEQSDKRLDSVTSLGNRDFTGEISPYILVKPLINNTRNSGYENITSKPSHLPDSHTVRETGSSILSYVESDSSEESKEVEDQGKQSSSESINSDSDQIRNKTSFHTVDLRGRVLLENIDLGTEELSRSNGNGDAGSRRISVLSEGKLILQTSNKTTDEDKDRHISPKLRRKITVIGRASKDFPKSPPTSPLPMKKIEVTTKFNFEESGSDFENSLNESVSKLNIHEKAVCPPRPPPPRLQHKTVPSLQISAIELQQQLLDIDSKLTDLELRGRGLEESIRNENTLEEEDDELINDWFKMVCERNELVRKEADLVYITKQQDLEDEQEHIESQLYYLMSKPYDCKSVEEKEEENYLIKRKLELVEQRNKIVDSMDEDRLRYEHEDRDIKKMKETGLWRNSGVALGSVKKKKVSRSVFYS